ncbi:MAG: flagellar biosynthetic protein FliR [Thermogutta sp.]|nr:flagellar biosynthetic protein FliR [Thermogutta sp.]
MGWLVDWALQQFFLFTLVFFRTGGLVIAAPGYGSSEIPLQIRALFAFSLALVLTPLQDLGSVPQTQGLLGYGLLTAGELALGFMLGFGVAVILLGIELGGELIARMGGVMMSDVYDPSAESEVPVFSRLLFLLALTVYLAVGGHRLLLEGLIESFRVLPPGRVLSAEQYPALLVDLVSQSFVLGIRVGAPAATALLTATLVLGLVSRTLPQLNLLMLGFGINAVVAMGALLLTVGLIAQVFEQHLDSALGDMFGVLLSADTAGG